MLHFVRSPRRSKYDKCKIKTDAESQVTPSITPKSKREAKNSGSNKKRGSRTPKSKSKRDNTLLDEDVEKSTEKSYGMCVCQPVGCGAGDGGSGCTVS
jgi:hypothetical protein